MRQQLLEYSYPGNVRELKNIVERALLLSDFETISQIELGDSVETFTNVTIEPQVVTQSPVQAVRSETPNSEQTEIDEHGDASVSLKEAVGEYERTVIIDCLNACNWHTKKAAEQLSLPLSTLNHKMKKYDISAA